MTEPVLTTPPSETPPAVTPPATPSAAPPPAAPPPAAPVAVARPEWLPEAHWDPAANTIKPEFGAHYAELKSFQEAEVARKASLPAKPEDYKLEPIIPEGVTLPPGMEIKFDPKDPETASLLAFAHESGLSQDQINKYVANDIRVKVERHNAEMARIAEQDKMLGANGPARKQAVAAYIKGMKDRGEYSQEEYAEIFSVSTSAPMVTAIEKLIAKAAGAVPGHQPPPPAPTPARDHATRIWGENAFQSNPQAKAS